MAKTIQQVQIEQKEKDTSPKKVEVVTLNDNEKSKEAVKNADNH